VRGCRNADPCLTETAATPKRLTLRRTGLAKLSITRSSSASPRRTAALKAACRINPISFRLDPTAQRSGNVLPQVCLALIAAGIKTLAHQSTRAHGRAVRSAGFGIALTVDRPVMSSRAVMRTLHAIVLRCLCAGLDAYSRQR